jgi:glycosyltransferase involved in cell wall biosynthesis
MKFKKNILILGYFGYCSNQLDGQTIKTRNVFDLISNRVGEEMHVSYFDVENFKKNKLYVFLMFWKILKSDTIVYLPAENNLKFIFPLVFIASKIFNINIIYLVVGGWLSDYLKKLSFHRFMLKKIKVLFVETQKLKVDLETIFNFKNVELFPNFRIHNFYPNFNVNEGVFRIVFMARVTEDKGLQAIFNFAQLVKKMSIKKKIVIDFYGPINEIERVYFFERLDYFDITYYKGIIDPINVYSVLNQYDVLVLPTYYKGEGFPGSIIDAYISGIPVVVSNWKQLSEFVDQGSTGFLFSLDYENSFYDYLLKLEGDEKLLLEMKKNAFEKSKKYSGDFAWSKLKPVLV